MADVRREPSLGRKASFLLSQLGAHSATRFAERLAVIGLDPRQYGMLVHLAAAAGSTQQELADSMGVHRNVMVGLVDDLEAAGLVERRRHPHDRRAYALHLTPRAKALLPRAERIADEHDQEMLRPLTDAQRRTLTSLLELVATGTDLSLGVHPGLRQGEPPRTARARGRQHAPGA